tara:strand:- start:552 stop:1073 length:522 start_codon:yes stop_codon:yes gene_type:complete
MPLNFDSDVDFVDQDVRYMDELYSLQTARFDAWKDWVETNLETSLNTYTIPTGNVVQAGTWNGDVYNELKRIYGIDRCVGFDIVEYIEDDTIIHGDFRTIHSANNMDCAIFYNGLGVWEHNATSKQAGLDYAIANLVTNGLYLEPRTAAMDAAVTGLEYVELHDSRLAVYRKV